MPKINVYLSDEMAVAVRDAQLPVSAICQAALERAIRELSAIRATDAAPGPDAASTPFSRYTTRARTALAEAEKAADDYPHNYVGTEHLLLGVLAVEDNLALKVLTSLDVEPADVRSELLASMGPAGDIADGSPPFTPLAKDALGRATKEALGLGHNYIGCEHLLLGLLAVEDGLAGLVLRRMGVESRSARRAIVAALSGYLLAHNAKPPAASDDVLQQIMRRLDRIEARLDG